MKRLEHVRIVMVNTTHPGNIGAAARAMKNMGLSDLALVDPKIFPSEEAVRRASGAEDLLDQAKRCQTLDEAIEDCVYVIGASARPRSIAWPQMNPRECGHFVVNHSERIAILLGREHSGLTNEELERCHFHLHIPSMPDFSSLNVASALQIIAYEIFSQSLEVTPPSEAMLEEGRLATSGEMASFFGHLEEVFSETAFLTASRHKRSIMRRLRRVFNRTQLQDKELHILRGALSAIQKSLRGL